MIRAYLAERFRPAVFLPLAAALAVAAAAGRYDVTRLAVDVLFGLLLLAEFRVWDDLADRGADAVTHPGRVIVRASSTHPFAGLWLALAFVNLVVCAVLRGVGVSMALLVLLHAAFAVWYSRRMSRTIAGDQLLLAKYPAFVLIIAGPRLFASPATVALAAAAIYIGASAYEAWHDPVSPLGAIFGGRS